MKAFCIIFASFFSFFPFVFSHTPCHSGHKIVAPLDSPWEAAFQPLLEQLRKDKSNRETGEANYRIRTIVIDPGHGGHDAGCSGAHSHEKDIVLNIGIHLGNTIKTHFPHIKVLYTRDRDVFIPLHQRAKLANSQKADLFISIHCNSIANADYVRGSETYVLGLHRAADNLEVAKRENASILLEENYQANYAGYDPNSAENHIIMSLFQNAFLEQSINFAEKVEHHIKHGAIGKSRGVKQAGFLVLRETAMPSVLIESGYLSNQTDDQYLQGAYGQQQIAQAIFRAFKDYKNEIESNSIRSNTALATVPAPIQQQIIRAENRQTIIPSRPITPAPAPQKIAAQSSPQSLIISSTPPIATANTDHTPALAIKSPMVYKVQLASGSTLLDIEQGTWKYIDQTIEIVQEGTMYKYLSPGFESIQQAIALRDELRKKGFKDAFVVAYEGSRRVK